MSEKTITVIPPVRKFTHRIGIYCRVSTRSQEQLESLSYQISSLTRRVAATPGWMLADIYLDVKSGSNASSRNEFQRMLGDCAAKKLDVILTKSVSRFGRNTTEILEIIHTLDNYGVAVLFDQESLNTKDPESMFQISIIQGIAQEEGAVRSRNISWGILRKAENGTAAILKRKCYGYYNDENGELKINEVEAKVVRSIFEMYLQGKSILGIIRELEALGIKSPTGKDAWSKRSIDVMLSNEKYSGDVIVFKTYNSGYPNTVRKVNTGNEKIKLATFGSHPAIISKEIFSEVQAEKERRSNMIKDDTGRSRKSTRYSSKRDNT